MSRATDLARGHTDAAIQTITEIMGDPFAENKDRLRAAEAILDRGHGKAAQAVIQIPATLQMQRKLATLTNDELLAIVKGSPLPRLALPQPTEPEPIDAEFTLMHSERDRETDYEDQPRFQVDPAHDPLLD